MIRVVIVYSKSCCRSCILPAGQHGDQARDRFRINYR